jgi:opacity protein-like surface antigen
MKTLRIVSIFAVALLFTGVAAAQQQTPTVEVFAGYTFIHANLGSTQTAVFAGAPAGDPGVPSFTVTSNIHGGSSSVAYNLNNWFGLVADFGGSQISSLNTSLGPSVNVDAKLFTYVFGPRFSYRKWKTITPFGQVLFGGAHITDVTAFGTTVAKSENAFAMTVGGGLDWNVTKLIAIRVGQVEYALTKFSNAFALGSTSNTQNNVRVSGGIVFRFGSK